MKGIPTAKGSTLNEANFCLDFGGKHSQGIEYPSKAALSTKGGFPVSGSAAFYQQ